MRFEFQLCKRGEKFPTGLGWCFQPKINGIRYAVKCGPARFEAFGRHSSVGLPEHIIQVLIQEDCFGFPKGTILDGEFQYGEDDHSSWGVIGRNRPPPVGTFYVFDCLFGIDDKAPLLQRLGRIDGLPAAGPVRAVPDWTGEELNPEAGFEQFLELGYEGMVAKRLDAPYTPGRHASWLKFKPQKGK